MSPKKEQKKIKDKKDKGKISQVKGEKIKLLRWAITNNDLEVYFLEE